MQELQRKLAEEQVAAAMGQAPPVTSVSAGAAALGLTMGSGLHVPGARAPTAPPAPVRNCLWRSYLSSRKFFLFSVFGCGSSCMLYAVWFTMYHSSEKLQLGPVCKSKQFSLD